MRALNTVFMLSNFHACLLSNQIVYSQSNVPTYIIFISSDNGIIDLSDTP